MLAPNQNMLLTKLSSLRNEHA